MITLQEDFEQAFPNKNTEEINAYERYKHFNYYDETSLDLKEYTNLKKLDLSRNVLTSVDFLNTIPNPEKLEELHIFSNKIEPTDISIFSRFINLKILKIGTDKYDFKQGKHNKFYGSLKSYQNLTKLKEICIEATDVDSGLEYLPVSLEKSRYGIECSPHDTYTERDAKVGEIQNQLRPFDYDIEAWQLANPEKMLVARPELFTNSYSKDKWLRALSNKLGETEAELLLTNKLKKTERLKQKQENLSEVFTPSPLQTERVDELKKRLEEKYKVIENTRKQNRLIYSSSNSLYGFTGLEMDKEVDEIIKETEKLELQLQIEQKPK